MRKTSFIICLIGLFVLFFALNFNVKEISNLEDMENLEINQKVLLKGEIQDVRNYGDYSLFGVRGFNLICDCNPGSGELVIIEGEVEEYNGLRRIRVLRILEM